MDIITNTSQLRTIADRLGSHYFSPDTMRFFSSRVHTPVYGSRYFVTSEQMRGAYISSGWIPAEPRRYSVRSFEITRDAIEFDTLGEFQQYETREQAHSAARAAARALCTLSPVELSNAALSAAETLIWSELIIIDDKGTTIEASNAHANLSDATHEQLTREVGEFVKLVQSIGTLSFGGLTPERIGHDFILTRNGHGAGFWDEGLGELGERLSYWAKTFGTINLYVDSNGELSAQ